MLVVYIATSAIPSRTANSIHVVKMCEAIARQGHRTLLMIPDIADSTLSASDPYAYYAVSHNFNMMRLESIRRFPRGLSSYRFAVQSVRRAAQLKADLVYTRNSVVAAISCLFRLPTILELHECLDKKLFSIKIIKWFNVFSKTNFRKLVVITQPVRKYYISIGCPDEKIQVFPDAVDFKSFIHCESNAAQKISYRIGYTGSFYEGRGIELIYELSKIDEGNDYFLYGGSDEEIISWMNKTKDRQNITICGHVANADVPSVLSSMDVLLMPYQRKICARGQGTDIADVLSPMKMFEYMASGKPIISSDIPVFREVLEHEKNCLLVPPDDPAAWRAAVQRLTADRDLARRLGAAAREEARSRYTWHRRAEAILETLDVKSPRTPGTCSS